MPRRNDISKILLVGSGPIVIGQAAEFDYSGVQACKVLLEEGYEVVLVNSNPATIMTDPEFADRTYIEPLLPGPVAKVIERERPDALLPTLGGQTALNLAKALHDDGTLERFAVELIGADYEAIHRAEDREAFRATMEGAGLRVPWSRIVTSLSEAESGLAKGEIELPVIVRPAFTLGGEGGGVAMTETELAQVVSEGLAASPINQVLVEESVLGWGEFELEVMRDRNDNVVIICSIENVDPMGVHTGDSVTVAPAQTLTDSLYQELRDQAIRVIRAVGVETGGSNVQFAVDPESGEVVVIEMNPRVSRSSALASKATGFPIAKIAAKLAVGYALEEVPNDITEATPAAFEPTIDYVVTKVPRFAFEKFPGAEGRLSTHMKSVGEVMAIGRTFRESFAKAMRSRELDAEPEIPASTGELLERLAVPAPDRFDLLLDGFRRGVELDRIAGATMIDPWFLRELRMLATEGDGTEGLERSYRAVDTCAAEFEARTPYFYSAHERAGFDAGEVDRGESGSVMILGSGPNRIGQGIEFDYCCVHAAMTVRELERDAVMVNCNPETVSTDYDTSDRLYFEPLTAEDVLAVAAVERPEGVIVQFGGQTPLRLANALEESGLPLLGTPVDAIDLAEDRGRFGALLRRLEIKHPPYGTAFSAEEAVAISEDVGFPLLVRPSYVLGGRAMEICYSAKSLAAYLEANVKADQEHPLLLDRFLENAIEVDVDALADGSDCYVAGVMQHVEEAGVHSGDSACVLPPMSLGEEMLDEIRETTRKIALELGVVGLINVQYAVAGGAVRDRGEPARVADDSLRLQGDRRAARQDRLPADAGRAALRSGASWRPSRPCQRQGGRPALCPLRRRRRGARTRDAEHRGGDGHRRRLPDRVREGAGGRRGHPAPRGDDLHQRHRFRQAGRHPARGPLQRPRVQGDRHRGDCAGDLGDGCSSAQNQQDRRGLAPCGRLHPRRRGGPGDQHPNRWRCPGRWLRDPHRRGPPRDPLPDDDDRRLGSLAGDLRPGPGRAPGARPAGAAYISGTGFFTLNERVVAPFGRRLCEVTRNVESGGYRIFSVLDPAGPEPDAGQFYMLAAGSGWGLADERPYLARAFSVADAERRPGGVRLDFLVEAVGPGTERLAALEPGEGLWITGPLGRPFSPPRELAPEAAGAILVGGGIGIAPLALWRRRLLDRGTPARVLLGFRDREHSGGLALFDCSEIRLASDDGHRGHHGYVTDLLAVLLEGDDAGGAAVYGCGPPAMLEAVRLLCAERGVACELAMEAPMACGFGACFGCAVPLAVGGYMRLCVDGPVVRGEQLETALVPGSGH